MEPTQALKNLNIPHQSIPIATQIKSIPQNFSNLIQISNPITQKFQFKSAQKPLQIKTETEKTNYVESSIPNMYDITESSRRQNLDIHLQTFGPFFRITAKNLETQKDLGRAEGVIRVWFGGKILHLDSIRLRRETLGMEKSIFGIGLFIGAVAIRHGYESGCKTAELLAINDTDLYHSKLVRFYKRIGFRVVYEVTGSSLGDMGHMLVWGGFGTRMDANVEDLMVKWCSRFKNQRTSSSEIKA